MLFAKVDLGQLYGVLNLHVILLFLLGAFCLFLAYRLFVLVLENNVAKITLSEKRGQKIGHEYSLSRVFHFEQYFKVAKLFGVLGALLIGVGVILICNRIVGTVGVVFGLLFWVIVLLCVCRFFGGGGGADV